MRINVVLDEIRNFEDRPLGSALRHAVETAGIDTEIHAIHTSAITSALIDEPRDGIVVGHGSPFERPDLVDECIRSARERGVPLVGT